jgi:hypothetical protein
MAKLTPFAVAAVALLGACSTTPPQPITPNIATIVHPMRPGTGVVQAVMPAPMMVAGATASAGSSEPMQRLEIKMSDGRVQYVDTKSGELARGDRVQLSEDGIIRKV